MDLNFQYAHHALNESETQSNISKDEAMIAFDQFDWEGEVGKANELQKCSPTLSILINGQDEMLWVSGFGEGGGLQFVSECYFPGDVSRWFGLYKSKGTVILQTQTFNKSQAREALELIIDRNYDGLKKLFNQ
ncbi:hypothetical protein [Pseudoteredinibacter isoporae]|uniref:Uncharacterized protein n=1 Tax=Pseudoteredinibacter isoporae TaxID=570281 RepID=A0A7X0JS19_9GAMM|nr:hypothetical protein [Pseudoteredinibacter isoporae]MBB6520754.1 hypothetical protein [Pseudoteredinibacter isoporae]NHO86321.1 hypothetical protein [Pseudoteredinibacter isoporae]NIB25228.1 hypothetical protein [Pseudoteredinibacter isoporae]